MIGVTTHTVIFCRNNEDNQKACVEDETACLGTESILGSEGNQLSDILDNEHLACPLRVLSWVFIIFIVRGWCMTPNMLRIETKICMLEKWSFAGIDSSDYCKNDGNDACEWLSGLWIHHWQRAAPTGVFQQLCSGIVCQSGGGGVVVGGGDDTRQADVEAHAAGADLDDPPHALFNGRALSLNASDGEGSAGCACTCMPLADARRALPVAIWSWKRLSGSSTPAVIQGNDIVSICIMNSRSELGNWA